MSRRDFIARSLQLGAGLLLPIGTHGYAAGSHQAGTEERLIFIFLRGGVDGLSIIAPWSEPEYYASRPTIALNPPGSSDGLLPLDDHFGLHPALKPLYPLWQSKRMSFLHACGLKNIPRSHFDAQDILERGFHTNDLKLEGWLNRLCRELRDYSPPTGAITISQSIPLVLRGKTPVSSLNSDLNTKQAAKNQDHYEDLASLYRKDPVLGPVFESGLRSRRFFMDQHDRENMLASQGANDSAGFIRDARLLATLMAENPRVNIGVLSIGGWDTHYHQGSASGVLAKRLSETAVGLEALWKGLGSTFENTTIIVMSEFGRTVRENGSGGTDHGQGNVMWFLGGRLDGGKILGHWPGIQETQLFEGRDLAITTDYRAPLKAILQGSFDLGRRQLARVFPQSATIAPLAGLY